MKNRMKDEGFKSSQVDFSAFDTVFCESIEALNWAYSKGLSKSSEVRASSPTLLNLDKNFLNNDSYWDTEKIKVFLGEVNKYSLELYKKLKQKTGLEHELIICIIRDIIRSDRIIFKVASLSNDLLQKKVLVIKTFGKSGTFGNKLNFPWEIFLNHSHILNYKIKNDHWSNKKTTIPLIRRLRMNGKLGLIYKFFKTFSGIRSKSFAKKEVIIYRENELLTEIAANLSLHSVKLGFIDAKPDVLLKHDEKFISLAEDILKICKEIIECRVHKYIHKPFRTKVFDQIIKNLSENIAIYYSGVREGKSYLGNKEAKNKVFLSSVLNTSFGAGLTRSFRNQKIPVVSVQHGVSAEISQDSESRYTRFDSCLSDLNLVFNESIKNEDGSSPFSLGQTVVVGSSSRHMNVDSSNNPQNDIVYVSTCLYRGNIGPIISYMTDFDRSKKEIEIIDALEQIPHRVTYKTYPQNNRRYADEDLNILRARNSKKIEIFEDSLDMRYLLSNYKILITNGATSTLSWLLYSRKPLILIIYRGLGQFKYEYESDFCNALFVFYDDEYQKMINFLSQPISVIQKLWEDKSEYQKILIEKYFSKFNIGAGKRGQLEIEKLFN